MDDINNSFQDYLKEFKNFSVAYTIKKIALQSIQDVGDYQNDEAFSKWYKEQLNELTKILNNQISLNNEQKIFFRGCNFSNYKVNFNKRCNEFLKKFEDATKFDFIQDEISYYENKKQQIAIKNKHYFETIVDYLESSHITQHIIKAIGEKQYVITSNKILKYLKEELKQFKTHGNRFFVNITNTPEVNKLVIEILYNNLSLLSTINYIDSNTNNKTLDLFLNELFQAYNNVECELLLQAGEDDIKAALKIFEHQLEYIYVKEDELLKIQHFIRIIDSKQTVFNVVGFSKEPSENSLQIILLNNTMVNYYNGFFGNQVDGFGDVLHFNQVIYGLKRHYISTDRIQILELKSKQKFLEEENLLLSHRINQQKSEQKNEDKNPQKQIAQEESDDFHLSTIKEYLEDLEPFLNEANLSRLTTALDTYFKTGNYFNNGDKIIFKPVNKKRVGWVLKKIHRTIKPGTLPIEYFEFAKNNIHLFKDEVIETDNFTKSKFYKYFTTKPAN